MKAWNNGLTDPKTISIAKYMLVMIKKSGLQSIQTGRKSDLKPQLEH